MSSYENNNLDDYISNWYLLSKHNDILWNKLVSSIIEDFPYIKMFINLILDQFWLMDDF